MGLPSTALAALPWICPVLSHQEVNLPSHFHVVDPPACFIALPLAAAAGLLIVAPSLYDFSKPISSEDSGQGPVCTFHVPLLNHHSPGNELQVFSHDFTFKSSFSRTYRLRPQHSGLQDAPDRKRKLRNPRGRRKRAEGRRLLRKPWLRSVLVKVRF